MIEPTLFLVCWIVFSVIVGLVLVFISVKKEDGWPIICAIIWAYFAFKIGGFSTEYIEQRWDAAHPQTHEVRR